MDVLLVMFRNGRDRNRTFTLAKPATVIGRREDCDLRIPLPDVSRKHCKISIDGPMVSVEDMGSSNGTFVNGRRVQRMELEPGDTIQVGPVAFVVQIDGDPEIEQMQPMVLRTKLPSDREVAHPDEASMINEVDADPQGSGDGEISLLPDQGR